MSHLPVMLHEVCEYAAAIKIRDGWFIDGTFGRGGHAREILRLRPDMKYLALDQDEDAVEFAKKNFSDEISAGRFEIHRSSYEHFARFTEGKKIAGVLLDLGVSSPQLDEGPRGFSFYKDGPLDMRMDQSQVVTAAAIINEWDEESLIELFKTLGEVHSPYKVVKAILRRRATQIFETTQDLANFMVSVDGWRKKGHHPATNYFLALRLQVNRELEILANTMQPLAMALENFGRLLIITFHSLEDRIVKNAINDFVEEELGQKVTGKVIVPTDEEVKANPRSRSAKLRVWQKGMDEDLLSKNERKKKSATYIKK